MYLLLFSYILKSHLRGSPPIFHMKVSLLVMRSTAFENILKLQNIFCCSEGSFIKSEVNLMTSGLSRIQIFNRKTALITGCGGFERLSRVCLMKENTNRDTVYVLLPCSSNLTCRKPALLLSAGYGMLTEPGPFSDRVL